jgi:acetoin utilization deacetylase AcuC-like enzyme
LLLYYCDHHDIPLPPGHKFPMEKYRLLRQRLEGEAGFRFAPGPLAAREDLLRVHEARYLDRFLAGALSEGELRRIGFPNVPQLVTRTLASTGATVAAADFALREGRCGVLAGGTHHAHRDFGAGFCVLNDIAVSAARLLARGLAKRIAVIDLDVHQGDGTAAIFAEEPRVFTFSAHGKHNFPFRKQQSSFDLEFENGTEGGEYLARLEEALPRVWTFEPDFVFYQAGVDGLKADRLGKLALTRGDLAERDGMVFEGLRARSLPYVVTLGGGYGKPIGETVEAAAVTYLLAQR